MTSIVLVGFTWFSSAAEMLVSAKLPWEQQAPMSQAISEVSPKTRYAGDYHQPRLLWYDPQAFQTFSGTC